MTTGQRIAALRRQHNLSQEELGEHLGVSRQAISKWESDSAIPELEKLIALARLFRISVGVLLGVEEEPPAEETVPTSEQQDALAARILEQYSSATRKQLRRMKFNIACGVIIAFALLSFFIFNNLKQLLYLQDQISGLTEQVTLLQEGSGGSTQQAPNGIPDHDSADS